MEAGNWKLAFAKYLPFSIFQFPFSEAIAQSLNRPITQFF